MDLHELIKNVEATGRELLGDRYSFSSVNITGIAYSETKYSKAHVGITYRVNVFLKELNSGSSNVYIQTECADPNLLTDLLKTEHIRLTAVSTDIEL